MRRLACGIALSLIFGWAPVSAQKAVEYRAVGDTPAILYDAPAVRGKKLFVAPRGMPFEVVVTIEGWLKVRDRSGDMAWLAATAASTTLRRDRLRPEPPSR